MNYTEFKDRFSIHPDEQQEAAILSMEQPTLLHSVPGSGKTETVLYRIGYMVYVLNIDPSEILVISFSKHTALDLQFRFSSLYGEQFSSKIQFRTVSSLCNQIIYDYYRENDLKKPRLIKDNTFLLRRLYSDIYRKVPAANEIRDIKLAISRAKNLHQDVEFLKRQTVGSIKLLPIYSTYVKELKRSNGIDYDDQMLMVYDIFGNNPDYLRKRQAMTPHIVVDEAQDISRLQHEIINYLADGSKSFFMAGDDNQSIYSICAAHPNSLIDFSKSCLNANIIKSNHNYRSTPQIVQLANVSLSHDKSYISKKIIAARDSGQKVKFSSFNKREEQYSGIIEKLLPNCEGKTAILYRDNNSAIPLILQLVHSGIQFSCVGMNTIFFNSRVVIDIKNIMKSALHPHDKDLLWNTYSLFETHVGEEVIREAIDTTDKRRYLSLWHKIFYKCDINRAAKEKIRELITMSSAIRKGCTARDAIDEICKIGYRLGDSDEVYILKALTHEGEDVKEFLSRLKDIEKLIAEHISDTDISDSTNLVLSNIHASKGCEYDNVIIMDEVSPVFPSLNGNQHEELRLFYVAITRAKNGLILLSYADSKQPYIEWLHNLNRNIHGRGGQQARKSSHGTTRVGLSGGAVDASSLTRGVRVNHKKYGGGTIEGIFSDTIEIKFDDDMSRKFKLSLCLGNGSLAVL